MKNEKVTVTEAAWYVNEIEKGGKYFIGFTSSDYQNARAWYNERSQGDCNLALVKMTDYSDGTSIREVTEVHGTWAAVAPFAQRMHDMNRRPVWVATVLNDHRSRNLTGNTREEVMAQLEGAEIITFDEAPAYHLASGMIYGEPAKVV